MNTAPANVAGASRRPAVGPTRPADVAAGGGAWSVAARTIRPGCGPPARTAARHRRALHLGPGPRAGRTAFYSAAVQAGSKSWKAFFFGSSDGANFITVDKPPASLWVMELSARIFGLNSWSILVPQALEGVATVGSLRDGPALVQRPPPGCSPGAVLALTPVAVLMFRFNNPDALLVLLLTLAAYAVTRAHGTGRHPLAGAGRGARGLRLPDEDAAGVPRRPGVRSGLPACRTAPARAADLAAARRGLARCSSRRLVGRDRR